MIAELWEWTAMLYMFRFVNGSHDVPCYKCLEQASSSGYSHLSFQHILHQSQQRTHRTSRLWTSRAIMLSDVLVFDHRCVGRAETGRFQVVRHPMFWDQRCAGAAPVVPAKLPSATMQSTAVYTDSVDPGNFGRTHGKFDNKPWICYWCRICSTLSTSTWPTMRSKLDACCCSKKSASMVNNVEQIQTHPITTFVILWCWTDWHFTPDISCHWAVKQVRYMQIQSSRHVVPQNQWSVIIKCLLTCWRCSHVSWVLGLRGLVAKFLAKLEE